MVASHKIIGRRFGVIDIGTNSVLCLITEQDTPTHFNVLEDRAIITRIGEGLAKAKELNKEAMERTLDTVSDYVDLCRTFHVDELSIVGTSALRRAQNSKIFSGLAKEKTGLELEIISGQREAQLSFVAVSNEFPHFQDRFIVLDIGGGSSELIFGSPDDLCSLDIGSVSLTEKFIHNDPPTNTELEQLKDHARGVLEKTFELHQTSKDLGQVIGVAGTVTTLVAVEEKMIPYDRVKVHGYELSREKIEDQIKLYKSVKLEERKKIVGLRPERADVILAGTIIAHEVIDLLRLDKITVSDYGLRHGIVYEKIFSD